MPHDDRSTRARRAAFPLRVGTLVAGAAVLAFGLRGLLRVEASSPVPGSEPWTTVEERPVQAAAVAAPVAPALEVVPSDGGPAVRWFDGRPIRPARRIRMRVTAYSPDERSCAPFADGVTASGYSVWTNGMKLAAADTRLLPFGTLLSVPGYDGGNVIPVLDRGGRIRGHRLDLLYPTHRAARQWGVQELDVTVWTYADGAGVEFTRPG